jgi:hypothetical protein
MRAGGAVLLALTGCSLPEVIISPPVDVLVAEVYLHVGAPVQWALLHRTTMEAAPGARMVVHAAAGGEMIYTQAAEDPFCGGTGAPPEATCYRGEEPWPGFLRAGDQYTLRVEFAGRTLTGATTIPADFVLRLPAEVADARSAPRCELPGWTSLEMMWTRSAGAWVYLAELILENVAEVLPDVPAGLPDPLRLLGVSLSAEDTIMRLPGDFGLFQRLEVDRGVLLALQRGLPPGAEGEVVLAALDRNAVNWTRGGNFNPSGPIRVPSLHGDGTGVFGSVLPRRFRFAAGAPESAVSCESEADSALWPAGARKPAGTAPVRRDLVHREP